MIFKRNLIQYTLIYFISVYLKKSKKYINNYSSTSKILRIPTKTPPSK